MPNTMCDSVVGSLAAREGEGPSAAGASSPGDSPSSPAQPWHLHSRYSPPAPSLGKKAT